jgi:hypothetical protein
MTGNPAFSRRGGTLWRAKHLGMWAKGNGLLGLNRALRITILAL